jgi:uncharacterized protein YgiM (DUF1202 family)
MSALLLLLLSGPAHAKDLRRRVGVGTVGSLSDVPALSVKVGVPAPEPQINFQVQAMFGTAILHDAADRWFVGVRGLYSVVAEDNMNVYAGAGVAYRSVGTLHAARISPVLGAEFFLFGLENLGLSVDWGLHLDLSSQGVDLTSFGGGGSFAAHYYF